LIAAVIEASHDANGMIWPKSIAPYQLCVIHIPKDPNGNLQSQFMDQLSIQLPRLFQDNDVILDDRDVSFGFKMKDAQLVGYPHILVVGKSFYEDGQVELHHRTKGKQLIPLKDVLDQLS
jgi:prolyl-tRNA synthetase